MRRAAKFGLVLICLVALTWLMVETQTGATASKTVKKNGSVKGIVTDSHNRPLEGATVYFVESSLIDQTPINQADVLGTSAVGSDPNATDKFDEPLEDIVFGRNPSIDPKTLPQAKTDASGKFAAKGLDPYARYFAFTNPSDKDVDHIPGGDQSRVSFQLKSPKPVKTTTKVSARGLDKGVLHIQMSWKFPSDATYIGTSACYVCHGDGATISQTTCKHTAHALMFHKMGSDTANQNAAAHKGSNWLELDPKFVPSTTYNKPITGTTMTTLWFQDNNDSTNSFNIYETNTTTATAPATTPVIFKAYLWKDPNNVYKVTIENVFNPKDPLNLTTLVVPLTMGGYIRQRLLVNIPGLKGTYTLFQYQSLTGSASQGLQGSYDRNRKPWAVGGTGGGGFTNFYTVTKKDPATVTAATLKLPTKATSNVSCAVCHYGAGNTTKFVDATTGETLAHTVDDPNGVFDLGGDGRPQDVGVSCEQCHGPGSKHREEALKTVQVVGAQKGGLTDTTGKYIVNPAMLGADRSSLICGRCHDASGLKDETALFPPVGISRTEFIANYVTRRGIAQSNVWDDGVHAKGGHHGFTYSNFILSKHYRNSTRLLACDNCHDAMGDSDYRYSLKDDPDNSSLHQGLCNGCHDKDIAAHAVEKTGNAMTGSSLNCIQCHMTRTGKTAAGRPGLIIGTPTGAQTDANLYYWEGDQSSHVFDVIKKFDKGVPGVVPGNAMPAPYTNSCGTCHNATQLQFQQPK